MGRANTHSKYRAYGANGARCALTGGKDREGVEKTGLVNTGKDMILSQKITESSWKSETQEFKIRKLPPIFPTSPEGDVAQTWQWASSLRRDEKYRAYGPKGRDVL